jgi:hypothetical protein
MAEKIKRLAQFARLAVVGMIQAKTSSRQPNEAETYLVTQERVITILDFAVRVRRKRTES